MSTAFTLAALLAVQLAAAATPDAAALPDVESVLIKATGKVHDFAEQAAAMQHRVALQQEKSKLSLAAQKATYEIKLAQQAAQSQAIGANSTAIDNANKALQISNVGLEAEVRKLQDGNAKMRRSLMAIDTKASAAKLFLEDSLRVTDDTDAEELRVLVPTTPKPTLDHFLAVAGAPTGGDKLALLQVSRARRGGPEDLVSLLSKSLADIASAEVEGAAELRAHFLANFEEGQKRQEALNATQAQLLELQSDLKARRGKLLVAKAHLETTSRQLHDRLHGLRVFARKVDGAAGTALKGLEMASAPPQNATVPAPKTQMPVLVAAAPAVLAAHAVATKTQESPQKAGLAGTHERGQEASAVRKPRGAAAPKPEERHRSLQEAPTGISKPQHTKRRPEPSVLVQTATVSKKTKAKEPSFMSTWFSALR